MKQTEQFNNLPQAHVAQLLVDHFQALHVLCNLNAIKCHELILMPLVMVFDPDARHRYALSVFETSIHS